MSQQICVLQCIECRLFQVDIVKKSNKWQCKVCNVKQNVSKEFVRGSGQECRVKAQELNFNYGKQQERNEEKALERHMKNLTKSPQQMEPNDGATERLSIHFSKKINKWNDFVEDSSNLVMPNNKSKQMISGSLLGVAASNQREKGSKRQHSGDTTITTIAKKPSSYNKWKNFM